jgi:hypothetical protein
MHTRTLADVMPSAACWTCRLRRKKCNRGRPLCSTCAELGIECHYSVSRPEWMDGSEKQTDMARTIKAQVKQSTAARRQGNFTVQVFSSARSRLGPQISVAERDSTTESPLRAEIIGNNSTSTSFSTADETDNFFVALYLDTVFPFLFPWYQPSTLSGGRSWLLALLKANRAIFHTAVSISSYYFTLLLAKDASHTVRTPCDQHVWDTLAKHMDASVEVIGHHLDDFNMRQLGGDVFQQSLSWKASCNF